MTHAGVPNVYEKNEARMFLFEGVRIIKYSLRDYIKIYDVSL